MNIRPKYLRPCFILIAILVTIILFFIPLPAVLLDILLVLYGLLILLVCICTLRGKTKEPDPLLPTKFLIGSIFGVLLLISSYRLIITKGSDFNSFIIRTLFTSFFKYENTISFLIGIILFAGISVFIILVTHNAARIPHVAARFMLDSLPGKQMAIESEEETFLRKDRMRWKCDYFGSLDSAMTCIRSTSKMEIGILCLSIIGSLIIAAVDHGESITVLKLYPDGIGIITRAAGPSIYYLIIGFFLLQLPNLIMAITAGIITRRVEDKNGEK